MPRRGVRLDQPTVFAAAAELGGIEGLTLAQVAEQFGIHVPLL